MSIVSYGRGRRLRTLRFLSMAVVLVACQGQAVSTPSATPPRSSTAPTASETAASETEECLPAELVGRYRRERTSADTSDSSLTGMWVLQIGPCDYQISVDGIPQGGGRLELVEGSGEAGRLALSEDLGCPNEFTGEALYDFTFDGTLLRMDEAIAATDQCEGRAAAFGGAPDWSR